MNFLNQRLDEGIATITIERGKVNALNDSVLAELKEQFEIFKADDNVKAVILTGTGKFFSFGFDIPEFLSYTKEAFLNYLSNFSDFYTYLFLYPKPVVAALNGHTIAGGCMLATACDNRVMVSGKARISLNEIGFGSSVFAGSTEMLRFLVGNAHATEILYSGGMFTADEAKKMGLVQKVSSDGKLLDDAGAIAKNLSSKSLPAFTSIKLLLRKSVAEEMMRREEESIREFVDIWYSEATWANLKKIKIY